MVTNENNFWSWDKLSSRRTTAVSMIYKYVFPLYPEEYSCHREVETRALWEVWLWWKTNCSSFILVVSNESFFRKQLYFSTLLITHTRAIHISDLWMHSWKWEGSLLVLFLCNLKSKPFSEFQYVRQNSGKHINCQEEKSLHLNPALVQYTSTPQSIKQEKDGPTV